MNYSEKLRDPRWQKKRLEILERDEWSCQWCGDKKSELHVHHEKYKGQPWEIENEHLETVCLQCHSVIEDVKTEKGALLKALAKSTYQDHQIIYAFLVDPEGVKVVWIYDHNIGGLKYLCNISPVIIDLFYKKLHPNDAPNPNN